MEETTIKKEKQTPSNSHSIVSQIFIPIVVAIVVGLFTYYGTIKGVTMSNENSLDIARKNNEALLESIDRTNKSNQAIAQQNNEALLQSVEKSSLVNREISEKNSKIELLKIKEEFQLREREKKEEEKQDSERAINLLVSDIRARLTFLNGTYTAFQIIRNNYKTTNNFKTLEELKNFVRLSRIEPFVNSINLSNMDINIDKITDKTKMLPLALSSKILLFYRNLELLKKITDVSSNLAHTLTPKEYQNYTYNQEYFAKLDDNSKINSLEGQLLDRNIFLFSIMSIISTTHKDGMSILSDIINHEGSKDHYSKEVIKDLPKESTNDLYLFPEKMFLDIKKLRSDS